MAGADLIIGCDPIVTAGKETVLRMREGRTHVALNAHSTPTAAFVKNADWANPADACAGGDRARPSAPTAWPPSTPTPLPPRLMGDSIYTNPMMLGYAWQKGWMPLGARVADARDRAQRRGGGEQQGRLRVGPPRRARPGRGAATAGRRRQVIEFKTRETLESLVARRVEFLDRLPERRLCRAATAPSSSRCAQAEAPLGRTQRLTEAVARYLFKLMAYKDEYEVARLHTDGALPRQASPRMFEGDYKINYHLAPPLHRQAATTRANWQKRKFGPSMLTALQGAGEAQGPARHGASTSSAAPRSAGRSAR